MKFKIFAVLIFLILSAPNIADASNYAWSESLGYFDFSNVTVTNNQFSGYAYNDNSGFLNMSGVNTSWNNSGGSDGTSIKKRVESLESQDKVDEAQNLREKYPNFFNIDIQSLNLKELTDLVSELQAILKSRTSSTASGSLYANIEYNRDLELGMSGEDVKKLQNYLINQGYLIPDGVTGYFGNQTRTALINFQKDKLIVPAAGYFGPITKEFVINNS